MRDGDCEKTEEGVLERKEQGDSVGRGGKGLKGYGREGRVEKDGWWEGWKVEGGQEERGVDVKLIIGDWDDRYNKNIIT